MNLKEAFRFQNRLRALMDEAEIILSDERNLTRTENTHLRRRVEPEAENVVTVEEPVSEFADRVTDVAGFLVYLLGERACLAAAIRRAKDQLSLDMDSETGLNADRQRVAGIFRRMTLLRAKETTVSGGGTGYRFNADGNQVAYRCDLRKVTTINFDRNVVRAFAGELDRRADEVSAELDRCVVNTEVDYRPPFGVSDTFAEAFDVWASAAKAQ